MSPTPPVKLNAAELATALSKLPQWRLVDDKLHREYAFADFVAAFGFMTGATHDAGGVSALDVELAHAMDDLAARQPRK